jgi:uncharacterized membrane protein YdjX (TVP38/TMEM64 family)
MPEPARKRLRDHLDTATLHKLAGILIVVFALTVVILVLSELFGGTEKLRQLVEETGTWAPVVYVAVKAATYVFAPLSGASVEITAGALFGVWPALLLSTIGNTIGGSINYWVARTLGRKGIAFFAGKKALAQIDHTTEKMSGWKALLIARIVLSPIYDFVSYAAGLVRIPYWQYVLITAIVGLPITFLFPFIGDVAAESSIVTYFLIGFTTLIAVALGIILWKHKRANKS